MRAEMKKISDERARVKAMQDETYLRMRSLKSDKYGKTKVWGENRCEALLLDVLLGIRSVCRGIGHIKLTTPNIRQ